MNSYKQPLQGQQQQQQQQQQQRKQKSTTTIFTKTEMKKEGKGEKHRGKKNSLLLLVWCRRGVHLTISHPVGGEHVTCREGGGGSVGCTCGSRQC